MSDKMAQDKTLEKAAVLRPGFWLQAFQSAILFPSYLLSSSVSALPRHVHGLEDSLALSLALLFKHSFPLLAWSFIVISPLSLSSSLANCNSFTFCLNPSGQKVVRKIHTECQLVFTVKTTDLKLELSSVWQSCSMSRVSVLSHC